MIKLLSTLLFIFCSFSSFSSEDNDVPFEGASRVEIRARTVDLSYKDLYGLNFEHEYFSKSIFKNGQWVEEQTSSMGFHATKETLKPSQTKISGFQTEENIKNSRVLSYVDDPNGNVYSELVSSTAKYKNAPYNLLNENCGTYVGRTISNSNLDKDTKTKFLNQGFCFNNGGIGKSEFIECKNYINENDFEKNSPNIFTHMPNQ